MAEVTTILCPKCHKSNLRRARFCQHCGHDIVLNNENPGDERRYVITRVIKQGGQGAVYEGIDNVGKVYAVKEMLDRFTDPKERIEAIERFNTEAEMLQRLSHPRIPRVYSHFRDEGRHYLAMDFVRGEDLEEIVARGGPVPEPQVLEWADQLCDVLDHLHARGLIYRDMKPSNVMIDRENGGIKLVDFGITKLFKPTERGTQIGTPGYAPPEQYQGLATPQSDIYALGATLHHLLTGRDPTEQMPFSFPRADTVAGVKVSSAIADALEKALQKVPQDRFTTMREFWYALRPDRTPVQGQVRVAPATARIPQPAAAQVGTPPRPAPVPAPPVAAPARARSQAQPAPQPLPPAFARPAPPKVAPRRGFLAAVSAFITTLVRVTLTLVLVATLGFGAYVYFQRPAWAEPYVGPILDLVPTALPNVPGTATATPQLTSRQAAYDLEVTVPAGADPITIRQAFVDAFVAQAQAQYGPAARVNTNVPLSYVGGEPTVLESDSTNARYGARMQGFVFAP